MKRTLLNVLIIALSVVAEISAKPKVVLGPGTGSANFRVPYHQNFNRILSSDTTYILTGWYFVDSTYQLTIPAGTVVLGDSPAGGTLIISRGAKIIAVGSKQKPIIFTSSKPSGSRSPGDWGGIIVLGNAPTNKPTTQQVEGGFGTIPNTNAMYGGSNPLDNSGILRYVRIEFAGIAFSQDNEINGLTLGGVGSGTTIEYVQVSYANDDDIECFGGTVDLKYCVSMGQIDDTFDTDFGWAGRVQFYYALRDKNLFDASASGQSNGFESDNEGSSPYSSLPRTKGRLSNFTYVGPLSDTNSTINSKWGYVALLRRATELSIYNSVLVGWPLGINLRDTLTQRAAIDGRLQIKNTSIAVRKDPIVGSSSPSTGNIPGFNAINWFMGTNGYPATGNLGGSSPRQPFSVGLNQSAWLLNPNNNPVPESGSEIATASTSFDGRLAGDSWFDTTAKFRGAFNPSLGRSAQWDAGWTNYDPQNYDPEITSVIDRELVVNGYILEQNYPNPFNPSTRINFTLPSDGNVKLAIYNLLGQKVAELINDYRKSGAYTVNFDGSNLSSGIYFYNLDVNGVSLIRKMTLIK